MPGRLLLAIGSRLSRQKETASSISINSTMFKDEYEKGSARAFYSIMQVNPAAVESLVVDTAEREDWELVARGMKLQPRAVKEVVTTKAALGPPVRTRSSEAKRNNIKDIWDAVGPGGFTINSRGIPDAAGIRGNVSEKVDKSETGWARLEQIMDMSQEEFEMK